MGEKVFFGSKIRLCGVLSSMGDEIVILCHGFSSSKDSRAYKFMEEMLNEKDISTLRFDFFGHGESMGDMSDITISEAVDDVLDAIKFVKKRGFSKIGLFGSSFGGFGACLAAQKVKVDVLALRSAVSEKLGKLIVEYENETEENWKKQGFIFYQGADMRKHKLNYKFFKDSFGVNSYDYASKIIIPTLIVHGDKDKIVPIEQSIKLASKINNSRFEIIKGADHRYSKPAQYKKTLKMISKFISDNL